MAQAQEAPAFARPEAQVYHTSAARGDARSGGPVRRDLPVGRVGRVGRVDLFGDTSLPVGSRRRFPWWRFMPHDGRSRNGDVVQHRQQIGRKFIQRPPHQPFEALPAGLLNAPRNRPGHAEILAF